MPSSHPRGRHTLALLALTFAGCFSTSQIRPTEIPRLDGYETRDPARARRRVETLEGEEATLDAGATLALDGPEGRIGGRFASISVRDGLFRGQTVDGRTLTAPVTQIRAVDISRNNLAGTLFLVAAGVLAIGAGAWLWSARPQSKGIE
jgi:hypothetical protein